MSPALREVTDRGTLDRICRFRVAAWQASGRPTPDAFPDGVWRDPLDDTAFHFVAEDGDELVGAIRFAIFPTLHDMPEAHHYRAAGLDLRGPIGLPERLVIAPDARNRGIGEAFADLVLELGAREGVVTILSEVVPTVARMLVRRGGPGRRVVGDAPHDPRFPEVRFVYVATDIAQTLAWRASGGR